MLGWLKGIWGWASSGLDDLWHKFLGVLTAVYSYVDAWFNQLIADINSVWQWLSSFVSEIERWVISVSTAIEHWAIGVFNDITAWVGRLYAGLLNWINGILVWVSQWIDRIYRDVTGWIAQLESWIIQDIWNPLYNFISGAVRWIEIEGAWVFYLLTHPDQLALLLGRYILSSWIGLGHRYAKPVARWMVHTMLSAASEVGGILEDFIAGIL